MTNLEKALREAMIQVHNIFREANLTDIDIEIEAAGTVGEKLSITYTVGKYHDKCRATGSDLIEAVEEFARRHGWQRRQDAKLLPAPTTGESIDDEIPF